jgi:hypothetical protein
VLARSKVSKLRTLKLVAVLVMLAACAWPVWQWLNRPQDAPPPTFAIAAVQVWLRAGETSTIAIRAERGGVQGPIDVTFDNVPENVRIRGATIPGYFSVAICRRYPELRATVLDLPEAIKHAAPLLAKEGMRDRVSHRAGNACRLESTPQQCGPVGAFSFYTGSRVCR